MDIAEQVVVIFCGVRGYLDKVEVSQITRFEREFVTHIRSQQAELLKTIRDEGKLSEKTEAYMKELVSKFVAQFVAAAEKKVAKA